MDSTAERGKRVRNAHAIRTTTSSPSISTYESDGRMKRALERIRYQASKRIGNRFPPALVTATSRSRATHSSEILRLDPPLPKLFEGQLPISPSSDHPPKAEPDSESGHGAELDEPGGDHDDATSTGRAHAPTSGSSSCSPTSPSFTARWLRIDGSWMWHSSLRSGEQSQHEAAVSSVQCERFPIEPEELTIEWCRTGTRCSSEPFSPWGSSG